ncbi:MAG TPA: hypothetical protein VFA33_27625 [Bryobacteraceae bacterium]|nr:hypothetical protein [Bryobacteraceae bacterium]
MADSSKQGRINLLQKASDAAGVGLARLQELADSGNPDVAARATAMLVLERNEQDDLNTLRALVENQPENQLQPIPADKLAMLDALERSIDSRIQNSRLINASLGAATEILRSAEAIGQILQTGAPA